MSYMNESGKAVTAWLDWLKLTVADLLVVVDDVALPMGQVRLRPEGSAGGHNGLKSIESHLGTDRFARLRCGWTRCLRAGRWNAGCFPVSVRRRKRRSGG